MDILTQKPDYGSNQDSDCLASSESISYGITDETTNHNPNEVDFEGTAFGRLKRLMKIILRIKEPRGRPLLPAPSPTQPSRNPVPINYIIFDFIWNKILSEANRELLQNYKWMFFILSILIVVAILVVTGNLEYLKKFIKNLVCYLMNCLLTGSTDCYQ